MGTVVNRWFYRHPVVALIDHVVGLALIVLLLVTSVLHQDAILWVLLVLGVVQTIAVSVRLFRWSRDPKMRDREIRRREIEAEHP